MLEENCLLCSDVDGELIYKNHLFRIVLAREVDYPGYIRVIVNDHVKELTDLPTEKSWQLFLAVLEVERLIKHCMMPYKINIASLGNVVPHLHWHIIPRYKDDRHFPNPIWGEVTNPEYKPPEELLKNESNLVAMILERFYVNKDLELPVM